MIQQQKDNKVQLTFVLYGLYLSFTFLEGFVSIPTILTSVCQYSVILLSIVSLLLNKRMKLTAYIIWGASFILMMGISLLYTPDISNAVMSVIVPFIIQWLLNCALVYMCKSRTELNALAHIYMFVGLLFCAVCILFHADDLFNGGRFGYSVNRNPNEVMLQMLLPASFAFFYAFKNPKMDWRYFVIAVLFTALMLLTGSKKSILVLLFPVIMVIRKTGIQRIRYILIGIGSIIVVMYITFNVKVFYNSFGIRFEKMLLTMGDQSGNMGSLSDRGRFAMRTEAFRLFFESPIWGNGCESFSILSGYGVYSHNNYTEILCSYGVMGAAIYYSLPVDYLVKALKSKSQNSKQYISLVVGMLLVYLFIDWGCVTIFSRYNMFLFMYISMVYKFYIIDKDCEPT